MEQLVSNNHGLIILSPELEQQLPFSVSEVIFHHKGENENFMLRSKDDEFFLLKKYRKTENSDSELNLK